MNVRIKSIVIIACVCFCLIAGLGLVSQVFILNEFASLEEEHMDDMLDMTSRIIDLKTQFMRTTVHDGRTGMTVISLFRVPIRPILMLISGMKYLII